MDLLMPGIDGVATCREIVELLPDTRVLMLTASTDDEAVIRSVAAGATGYVVKDATLPELLETVKDVARGRVRIPLPVLRRAFAVADDQSKLAREGNSPMLTEREREVLAMFAPREHLRRTLRRRRATAPPPFATPSTAFRTNWGRALGRTW